MTSPASASRAAYDRELVTQFLAGDESAFVLIAKYYRTRMQAAAWRVLRNDHDAEEIVNDTFVRAYRAMHTFRSESSLYTWLHRIATNLAKNRRSYFQCRRCNEHVSFNAPHGESGTATLANVIADESLEGAAVLADRERFLELVPEAMAELPYHQQIILRARTVENLGYDEIGQRLGICVGSVKSGLARARMALRRKLQAKHAPLVERAA